MEIKDRYQKEESDFMEPCNTCIYRHENILSVLCPCRYCIHYTYNQDSVDK